MITLNRVLAFSAITFVALIVVGLVHATAAKDETIVDRYAVWAARAMWVFGLAGVVWVWRLVTGQFSQKPGAQLHKVPDPSVDTWHATLFAKAGEYHEDRVGQEAAKAWVADKLKELRYAGEPRWDCAEGVCTAILAPDAAATVRRRR